VLKYSRNLTLDIFDYSGRKLGNLYDNTLSVSGQAYDVFVITQRNGWKELSFSLPGKVKNEEGKDVDNFRLDYLKSDYKIRAIDDFGTDWFIVSEHRIRHSSDKRLYEVTAGHVSQLLKYKNLDLEFSDEEGNNVGTAAEFLDTILEGTGWTVGNVYVFREEHGEAVNGVMPEKRRSLKAAAKTGAFKLITAMCDLFDAKAVYNGDTLTVDILPMNPFSVDEYTGLPMVATQNGTKMSLYSMGQSDQPRVIELHYGQNVRNVSRTLNTENIVTKLNSYGSYGDTTSNYCGINIAEHTVYHWIAKSNIAQGTTVTFTVNNPDLMRFQFTVQQGASISAGDKLTFDLLDPASMMYIWNERTKHAYPVHKGAEGVSMETVCNDPTTETKKNSVHYLMDFTYYDTIGLFSDEMLQALASFQQNSAAYYQAAEEAAAQAADAYGRLSEVIATVDYCKLAVSSVSRGANSEIVLVLNTNDYPDGVIWRSDFDSREREYFSWNCANALKDDGKPTNPNASVIYMIGRSTPTKWVKAYLKSIDNIAVWEQGRSYAVGNMIVYYGSFYRCTTAVEGGTDAPFDSSKWTLVPFNEIHPKRLTLWTTDLPNDANVEYFLLGTDSAGGDLGAYESFDDAAKQSIAETSARATVQHKVYYTSGAMPVLPTLIRDYAWWWNYTTKRMYFCWTGGTFMDRNATVSSWAPVIITGGTEPPYASNSYYYDWKSGLVYYSKDGAWVQLKTVEETRIGSMFGTVYKNCLDRDSYREGLYETYTYTHSGADLPVGNYYFDLDDSRFYAFSTSKPLDDGESLKLDRINNTLAIHDSTGEVVPNGYQLKQAYSFNGVGYHSPNIVMDASFMEGWINDDGGNVTTAATLWGRGEQYTNPNAKYYRTGNLRAYELLQYSVSANAPSCIDKVLFYDGKNQFIGATALVAGGTFTTPKSTKYIRLRTRDMSQSQYANQAYILALSSIREAMSLVKDLLADGNLSNDYSSDSRNAVLHSLLQDIVGKCGLNVSATNTNWAAVISAAKTKINAFNIHYVRYNDAIIISEETYLPLNCVGGGDLISLPGLVGRFRQYSDNYYETYRGALLDAQEAIKQQLNDFKEAMGDLYREGTLNDSNYVEGDESRLYADTIDSIMEVSRPKASYEVDFLDQYNSQKDMEYGVREDTEIQWPDLDIRDMIHLVDPSIAVNEWAYIDKLAKCYDDPRKTKIDINTELSLLSQKSFSDVLENIANVASKLNAKESKYDKAVTAGANGSVAAGRLAGVLEANKVLITGTRSNWSTTPEGNVIFEAADGSSAMMLTGAGFAVARNKDEWGDWNWVSYGTGEGFSADQIVTGYLSAERIEAGSITADRMANGFGAEINLDGNAVQIKAAEIEQAVVGTDGTLSQMVVKDGSIVAKIGKTIKDTYDEYTTVTSGQTPTTQSVWSTTKPLGATGVDVYHRVRIIYENDDEKFEPSATGELDRTENIISGAIPVPYVNSSGIRIEDGTLTVESTGTIDMLANSTIWIGTHNNNNSITMNNEGISFGSDADISISGADEVNIEGGELNFTSGSTINVESQSGLNVASGGSIIIASTGTFTLDSTNLKVNADGAGTVFIKGEVQALSGQIAGWKIKGNKLYSGSGDAPGESASTTYVGLNADPGNGTNYAIWAGNTVAANAPFSVTMAGFLKAKSGTIGGWSINEHTLTSTASGSVAGLGDSTQSYAFWAGQTNGGTPVYYVTHAGFLHAENANIKGSIYTGYKSSFSSANAGVYLGSEGISCGANSPFKVTNAGVLTATSGTIGGWTIGAHALTSNSGKTGMHDNADSYAYAFWAGNATPSSAGFSVTHAGVLSATGATISGTLTSTSGSIGDFTISGGCLYTNNKSSISTDVAGVFIGSTGIALGKNNVFKVTNAGAVTMSNCTITGGSITIKDGTTEKFKVTSAGAATMANCTITGGSITIKDGTTEKFKVTSAGAATMANCTITGGSITIKNSSNKTTFSVSTAGYLTSVSGSIGGWAIGDHTLTSNNGKTGIRDNADSNEYAFWAGNATPSSANFYVKHDGTLYAKTGTFKGSLNGANITGATGTFTGGLTGASGTFGGVTLNSNGLSSTHFSIDGSGNATFNGTINGGSINIGNGNFVVNGSGEVTAKSITLKGEIQSGTYGTLEGWTFKKEFGYMYSGSGSTTFCLVGNGSATDTQMGQVGARNGLQKTAMWAGNASPPWYNSATFNLPNFAVLRDGTAYIKDLYVYNLYPHFVYSSDALGSVTRNGERNTFVKAQFAYFNGNTFGWSANGTIPVSN
jgi:hypothetical protein